MTMGIADFPVEIFKAFKAKSKDNPVGHTSTPKDGQVSPVSVSQASSQVDLSSENMADRATTNILAETNTEDSSLGAKSDTTLSSGSGHLDTIILSDTPATSMATSRSTPRGNSLKEALRGTVSRSRSRSNSRERKEGSRSSSPMGQRKDLNPANITLDSAIGASKGLSRIVGAGLKSPMDFTLGLARGFHNAPKLYGDDTVRPQERVTDFQSGLKAAGKVKEIL